MHHDTGFLQDIIVLLAAAVFVVAIFRQLRLSPVLGFLFAGAAIGPHGFEIISDVEGKSYLAEFGVVFLLFVIGLELSFRRLSDMRAYVLGLGGLQFLLTGIAFTFLANLLMNDLQVAGVIGFALALSSTAIVLQVLEERGERLSQVGRVSFSVLLLQDLAVVPLLIIVPILASGSEEVATELGKTIRNAAIVIFVMVVAGKVLLNPILSLVAKTKSSELFVALTLLVVLGASFASQAAGLSLALGGFLAGLMIAETQFRKQVESDIMPFKGLLMGLFFMTIGMNFDLKELVDDIVIILFYSLVLIAVKAMILVAVCKLFKLGWETSIKSAMLMAQGSEFAFILFGLADRKGLIDAELSQDLLLIVTVTMAVTPLIYAVTNRYFKYINKAAPEDEEVKQTGDLHGHFVICGFGWVGENLAKFLATDNVNFVALDSEPSRVKKGREMNMPVYYGDAARVEMLKSLQVDKAKAVIITIHDSKAEIRIIQTIKKSFPNIPIIVRAKHIDNIQQLKDEGATYVVPEAFESSIQIGKLALSVMGASEAEIMRTTKDFRKNALDLEGFEKED